MGNQILIGLAVVLGLFLIVVAIQPSTFSVTRSATLAVSRAAVLGNELPGQSPPLY